jgi:hypothetical protein
LLNRVDRRHHLALAPDCKHRPVDFVPQYQHLSRAIKGMYIIILFVLLNSGVAVDEGDGSDRISLIGCPNSTSKTNPEGIVHHHADLQSPLVPIILTADLDHSCQNMASCFIRYFLKIALISPARILRSLSSFKFHLGLACSHQFQCSVR